MSNYHRFQSSSFCTILEQHSARGESSALQDGGDQEDGELDNCVFINVFSRQNKVNDLIQRGQIFFLHEYYVINLMFLPWKFA